MVTVETKDPSTLKGMGGGVKRAVRWRTKDPSYLTGMGGGRAVWWRTEVACSYRVSSVRPIKKNRIHADVNHICVSSQSPMQNQTRSRCLGVFPFLHSGWVRLAVGDLEPKRERH